MIQKPVVNGVLTVLVIEDDPADQELIKRAITQTHPQTILYIVNDGEEALDYLHQRGPFEGPALAPKPDLIFLDLNMPKINGMQVLEQINAHPQLSWTPVVVLTTCDTNQQIAQSYELGCHTFITKPSDINQFIQTIASIQTNRMKQVFCT